MSERFSVLARTVTPVHAPELETYLHDIASCLRDGDKRLRDGDKRLRDGDKRLRDASGITSIEMTLRGNR